MAGSIGVLILVLLVLSTANTAGKLSVVRLSPLEAHGFSGWVGTSFVYISAQIIVVPAVRMFHLSRRAHMTMCTVLW